MSLQKYKYFQSKSVPFQEASINLYSLLRGIRQHSVNWSIHAWVAKHLRPFIVTVVS